MSAIVNSIQIAINSRSLEECERCISGTFIERAEAFREIRERGLYIKCNCKTFDIYCRWRWDTPRRVIDQQIAACDVINALRAYALKLQCIPQNEGQARQLVGLSPEAQREVAAKIDFAKATVEDVRQSVKEYKAVHSERKDPRKPTVVKLSDWRMMTNAAWKEALAVRREDAQFNRQDNDNIEWARWSWNPVTGCQHNCPYCYARDLAERFYEQKFEPTLVAESLNAPRVTNVPKEAANDIGYRNVFVCSMADLFGKWVPAKWIDAVLEQVNQNRQWNFLFLTKFPQRMAEFEYPPNAWLGTSIDFQARVKNAEQAMGKVKASIRWLSLEPLLEPIRIDWALFQWIVLGGASKSTQTPEWRPPMRWVMDISYAAKNAGCAVYHKANLYGERWREYPGVTPVEQKPGPEFQYLRQ